MVTLTMARPKFTAIWAASVCFAILGGLWAISPLRAHGLELSSNAGSKGYTQWMQEHYPFHLLNPVWFWYGRHWPTAELATRTAVVLTGLVLIWMYGRSIARDKQTGLVPKLSLTQQGVMTCTILAVPWVIITSAVLLWRR